uniref:Ionotropic glutamate receptor C-terminal domain-containing protein n=1 Tax=Daphnia galeata TaxID=27404 RepID=A0A8J2RGI9_9CRUS|nr:unnamed protein product [Daphnia galeata]
MFILFNCFLFLGIWLHILNFPASSAMSSNNVLNGRHLRIIWPRWEGNPKGLSGPLKGGVIIDYLQARFNFTYEMIGAVGKRTRTFQLFQSDLIVSAIVLTLKRNLIIDQTTPWECPKLGLLIPIQDDTANTNAVIKPFQWPAYTSTLFTYVVAPVNPPLVNSIYDIAESSDNNLLVKLAGTPESLFLNNNWTGFYEKIRERIKSYPQSRCTLVSECIDLVKPGLRNVFIDAEAYQKDAIKDNFEKTGKCNLQMARDSYMTVYAVMALQKNSPYTNSVNLGIMELSQSGLIDYWEILFRPMPRECQGKIQRGFKTPGNNQHPPLSLKNLTGAFIVLNWIQPLHLGFPRRANHFHKRSRYTDIINKGVLEIQQTGIIDYWEIVLHPMPSQCMANIVNSGKTKPADPKHASSAVVLSLKNLTGAFVVYLIGLSLSLLAFLCELVISVAQRQQLKTRRIVPNKNGEDSITK